MMKNNLTGWQEVFRFTLTQTLKSKAYQISFLILLLLSVVSAPLLQFIMPSESEDLISPIETLYIHNQSDLGPFDFTLLTQEDYYQNVLVETTSDVEKARDTITKEELNSVLLILDDSQGYYSLEFETAKESTLTDEQLNRLGADLTTLFDEQKLALLGVEVEQLNFIQAPITTLVSETDASGEAIYTEDTSISMNEYWFLYGTLFLVLMVNIMASTQIATSIVTEKSTRVVENLLISVKSLALMVGKVLAMLVSVLLQIISLIVVVFLSNKIVALLQDKESMLATIIPENIFSNINPINLLLCLLSIGLGMIFYGVLAGMFGATVSKIEEMNEGLMVFTFINLIGAYVGMGAAGSLIGAGNNPFVTFALLFPVSSPFLLPGAILLGKAGVLLSLLALCIQILSIALLFQFVAKIYEILILHTGDTIKLKALLKLSKSVKKGVSNEKSK